MHHDGASIKCTRVKDGLVHQDTSLFDPIASILSHHPNASAMSSTSIHPHSNYSTSPVVEQTVITSSHQHGIRPGGLSGQALASKLHSNMKHISQSFKGSKNFTSMQKTVEQLQEDDIWRITLFIAHTHQVSDTLSNPEKRARGKQLENKLNTLSDHHFEYKRSFIPSLSATRTTVHGLVGYTLYDAYFS